MTAAIVTIVHGRHEHLRRHLAALELGSRPPYVQVVVAMGDPAVAPLVRAHGRAIVVDLPFEGLDLPLAAARNRGFGAAVAAGADVLIGLDVDCLAGRDLVAGYADAVCARPDVVWSGPVTYLPPAPPSGYPVHDLTPLDTPHPARPAPQPEERVVGADPRLFWSLSFALSADAWRDVGGFDEAYVGYGAEDTDFGLRVRRAGLPLGWVGAARAYHQHHPVSSPPVEHLDSILRNAHTFHDRWGEWPMTGWLEAFEERGLVRRTAEGWDRVNEPAGAGRRPQ